VATVNTKPTTPISVAAGTTTTGSIILIGVPIRTLANPGTCSVKPQANAPDLPPVFFAELQFMGNHSMYQDIAIMSLDRETKRNGFKAKLKVGFLRGYGFSP
jgi:hypothetical protein